MRGQQLRIIAQSRQGLGHCACHSARSLCKVQVILQGNSAMLSCKVQIMQGGLTTLKIWFSPPVPAGRAITRTGESALLCVPAHVCKA